MASTTSVTLGRDGLLCSNTLRFRPQATHHSVRAPAAPAHGLPSSWGPTAYKALKSRQCATYVATVSPPETSEELSVEELKSLLQDTLWGTDRGLSASSDARAEINEIITQLEAKNPTPLPNEAIEKLNGAWKLAYTSNSELMALLALGRLPFVTVGDIVQTVDAGAMSVENRVQLSAPFSRTSLAASANFEVRSPKLLQLRFEEGQVATPELLADFELPASIDVMGTAVDLGPVQAALQPMEGPVRSLLSQVGNVLSGAPDLKFPITSPKASTWLLNTFLDGDLRVSRGDGGSIFVMVKDTVGDAYAASAVAVEEPVAAAVPPVVEPSAVIEEGLAVEGSGFFDE